MINEDPYLLTQGTGTTTKINTQCILCWGLNKETKKQTKKQRKKERKKQRHSMKFKKAMPTALA